MHTNSQFRTPHHHCFVIVELMHDNWTSTSFLRKRLRIYSLYSLLDTSLRKSMSLHYIRTSLQQHTYTRYKNGGRFPSELELLVSGDSFPFFFFSAFYWFKVLAAFMSKASNSMTGVSWSSLWRLSLIRWGLFHCTSKRSGDKDTKPCFCATFFAQRYKVSPTIGGWVWVLNFISFTHFSY